MFRIKYLKESIDQSIGIVFTSMKGERVKIFNEFFNNNLTLTSSIFTVIT